MFWQAIAAERAAAVRTKPHKSAQFYSFGKMWNRRGISDHLLSFIMSRERLQLSMTAWSLAVRRTFCRAGRNSRLLGSRSSL